MVALNVEIMIAMATNFPAQGRDRADRGSGMASLTVAAVGPSATRYATTATRYNVIRNNRAHQKRLGKMFSVAL